MGLSASPVERRAENYANGNRDARSRKPLVMVISAVVASVVLIGVIATGAAVLNNQPAQQHFEVEITPRAP